MRLSTDKDDPGYETFTSLGGSVVQAVLLNDVEIDTSLVETADDEEGFVVLFRRHADGCLMLDETLNNILRETRHGKVEIVLA
jgi:hypothetical protein